MAIERLTLANLITAGETETVECPRCRGRVTVPLKVQWVDWRNSYLPSAQCSRCGVGFTWHTENNPVQQVIVRRDQGKTNLWYADRELVASVPEIVG